MTSYKLFILTKTLPLTLIFIDQNKCSLQHFNKLPKNISLFFSRFAKSCFINQIKSKLQILFYKHYNVPLLDHPQIYFKCVVLKIQIKEGWLQLLEYTI